MEIFGIGWAEMLVIAIVALIVVGPERLPEVARTVGRALGWLSKQWHEVRREIAEPLPPSAKEIKEEIEQTVREAIDPRASSSSDSRSAR